MSELQDTQDTIEGGHAGHVRAGRDQDEIPRLGFFQLIPKRSLAKIVMLLLVLVGIVLIQRRSATVVKRITDVVMPPPPAEVAPPRVRLAPPVPTRP